MNNTYRYTLVPVILGGNLQARLLADTLFWRFRVKSYVMSEKRHPALFLAPTLHYRRLSSSAGYSDFVLAELTRLAESLPDKLLVLIGTTPYHCSLLRENRTMLEKYYILSDAELSFLVRESVADAEFYPRGERA